MTRAPAARQMPTHATKTSRRKFLKVLSAAAVIPAAASSAVISANAALPAAAVAVADPIADVIDAYYQETQRNRSLVRDLVDDDTPAWNYLARTENLPPPTTREGAIKAVKLAIEEEEMGGVSPVTLNLLYAMFAYLDCQPA
ncbi:hypothetical protein [Azorhizobium doebereinerae]|uniref:hypothetical protein n=1 Tax=Azorhizobium doebereinerae TaxID=281091 RepID=UPI00048DB24B|nr:hypothetical protein [Azorhizobium doebereinerae]